MKSLTLSAVWWSPLLLLINWDLAFGQQQHNLRRNQEENTCPDPPDSDTFSLSEDLVKKANTASELSVIVTFEYSGCIANNIESNKKKYELFDGWWDLQDQALVAKDNGTCYAVFMGTVPYNLFDQAQNLNPIFKQVPGSDCLARAGYVNGYYASYYKEMRKAVDTCVRSCGDGRFCPLVLHGHSQGGSIATVAAIDLKKYDPITITFGTPRTIRLSARYPCDDIDTSNQIRFINTIDGRYDNAVMNDLLCPDQIGIALLLDDVNYPIANVGLDNDLIREPVDGDALQPGVHDQQVYTDRIKHLAESSCFPVPATAWPQGHYCNYDDECLSGSCNGETCT